MPHIKDNFSVLAECAAIDLRNTHKTFNESVVKREYESIEEAQIEYSVVAEMVPVVEIDGKYYTESTFVYPFMRDNGIKSLAEALDCIAEANNLSEKSVGLLIESCECVNGMIERACQKESGKTRTGVVNKIGKAIDLAKDLASKGYPCKRKKSTNSKKCKK